MKKLILALAVALTMISCSDAKKIDRYMALDNERIKLEVRKGANFDRLRQIENEQENIMNSLGSYDKNIIKERCDKRDYQNYLYGNK